MLLSPFLHFTGSQKGCKPWSMSSCPTNGGRLQESLLHHSKKRRILIFLSGMCFPNTDHPHGFTLTVPTAFWYVVMKQQIMFGNVLRGEFYKSKFLSRSKPDPRWQGSDPVPKQLLHAPPSHLLHGWHEGVLELWEWHWEGELGEHWWQIVAPELTGKCICQWRVTAKERESRNQLVWYCWSV